MLSSVSLLPPLPLKAKDSQAKLGNVRSKTLVIKNVHIWLNSMFMQYSPSTKGNCNINLLEILRQLYMYKEELRMQLRKQKNFPVVYGRSPEQPASHWQRGGGGRAGSCSTVLDNHLTLPLSNLGASARPLFRGLTWRCRYWELSTEGHPAEELGQRAAAAPEDESRAVGGCLS